LFIQHNGITEVHTGKRNFKLEHTERGKKADKTLMFNESRKGTDEEEDSL